MTPAQSMKDLNISDTSLYQWGRSLRNHHGAATQVHEAENPWWGWSDLCKPAALDGTNNGSADDVGMDLGKSNYIVGKGRVGDQMPQYAVFQCDEKRLLAGQRAT